jgi:glutamine amidotransferase
MCRWIAYVGTPTLMHDFLYDGAHSLCAQAQHSFKAKLGVHGDGGGLAWYAQEECPGLYRHAGPAWADPNLKELTSQIRAKLFFAHVRASTGAPNTFVNCHPFRIKNWVFMHNGQIGEFAKVRRALENLLSDDVHALVQGKTDSELMFALMVNFGLFSAPEMAIRKTFETIIKTCRAKAITDPFRATIAVANGDAVWVVRFSTDNFPPSLFMRHRQDNALIASEPLDDDTQSWTEIKTNTLAKISKTATNQININTEILLSEEICYA